MKKVVKIPKWRHDDILNFLNSVEGCDYKGTYYDIEVVFEGEDIGVEIKVVGGDNGDPFVDAVIYEIWDENTELPGWHELYAVVGEDDIVGEYVFNVNGKEYIVEVVVED